MKKLSIVLTILISTAIFSSSCFANWKKIEKSGSGHTFYLDFEGIRKHDGYHYYWIMIDLLKPFKGYLSSKSYYQSDCKLLRIKELSYVNYQQPMGKGTGNIRNHITPKWKHPPPYSVHESILNIVCRR